MTVEESGNEGAGVRAMTLAQGDWDCRFQEVTCRRCRLTYQCTPANDYYNSTNDTDGVCFGCLLAEWRGAPPNARSTTSTEPSPTAARPEGDGGKKAQP